MAAEIHKAWQCIGCGRVDDPRPCIGVCRDQKIEYVLASEHRAEIEALNHSLEALRDVVLRIARTTPHAGEAEAAWLALQARARAAL